MRYMYYLKSNVDVVFVSETRLNEKNKKQLLKEGKHWLKEELDNFVPDRETIELIENADQLPEIWRKATPWGSASNENYSGTFLLKIIQEENFSEANPDTIIVNGVLYRRED